MIVTYDPACDAFWTQAAGIYRHSRVWHNEPVAYSGTYQVIAKQVEVLDFFCDRREFGSSGWNHRFAVVDDFGNLVRVK
jgi:hypothetical protein